MYSLEGYGKMAADEIRRAAYLAALSRVVTPRSVVIDLGCGPGLFSLHACRMGARKVYAIEPGDSIQIARDLAEANGFASRIEFIQDLSTTANLPERADVIVADLRGILPFCGTSIRSMIDARTRLLNPGGVIIPKVDRLWAALIEAPASYGRSVLPWQEALSGFDTSVLKVMTANNIYKVRTSPAEYLAGPSEIASIDYSIVTSASCSAEAHWTTSRDGTAHGLAVWFDTTLVEGVGFSNAPGGPELLYGAALLPLLEPLPVGAGDQVSCTVHADPVGDGYMWRWGLSHAGKVKFEQSTFFGQPLSANSLERHYSQLRSKSLERS